MLFMLFFSNMDCVSAHLKLTDIFIALLGLFIFSSAVHWLTNKGGPMLWPVLGIIPTFLFHATNVYDWITDALIESGGTFRYRGMWLGGAHGVLTVDPSNIEYMLKTKFKNFPKGKYYRKRFSDLLGSGIFNADDELWRDQRRVATSEMHSSRFIDYSLGTVQELVHGKLLKLIDNIVKSSDQRVDLQDIFLRFTFDNISIAAFGVDPGCLAINLPDVPFAEAFERATELTLFRFTVPPFLWKLLKFFNIGFEKELREAVKVVHEFAEKTVEDRMMEYEQEGHLSERTDLLSRFMEVEQYRFSMNFLRDFCISFILAGRDTSSVALAWFFWLIHKHPHIENKIINEVESVVSNSTHRNMNDENAMFTREQLKKMVYLQAALSESLRLYPSVPLGFKEVQEDDILPDGSMVSKGARVIYCIYSMARVESIWGKDCREFRPERWIKDGEFMSENQFKYPVFNAGPRLCVGKRFAYTQMKMVAASILLRYHVEVCEGQCVVPKMTTTLYMKNGLYVRFKPRVLNLVRESTEK
ncbi:hypothetical protein Sjap_023452 [Stephania japonica]|uniref:Cytochrome P450 n=1 Tax=Stephania japonica TaxID=461633 RepID=A0AAP0EDS6_9MAGN